MSRADDPAIRRRRLLALVGTGSAIALAGCGGGGGDGGGGDGSAGGGDGDGGDGTGDGAGTATPTPEPGVPAEYETATALGGQQRSPGNLSTKEAVNYQSEPKGNEQCSNCRYYIEDKNGDGMGACALVEGTIDPKGWCVSYARYEGDGGSASVEPVEMPGDARCAVCDMRAANFPDWNGQAVHDDDTRSFFCSAGCAVTYYVATDRFVETSADVAGFWVTDFETRKLVDGTTAYYALETNSDRVDDPMRLNPAPFGNRDDAVAYVEAVDYLTTDDIVELSAFDRDLAAQYRKRFLQE